MVFDNSKTNINLDILSGLKTETPFLLMDLNKVESNYKKLSELMPGFSIYYAMKCNPEQPILEKLSSLGSHFEIAAIGELHRLEKIGVAPSEVIFSNPVKIPSHIKEAYKRGVRNFAFDSATEIVKIAQNAPGSNVYARVSVSNYGSVIKLSNKFGANPEHIVALMGLALDHDLVPNGLAFHVGSQAENVHIWDAAILTMKDLIARLKKAGIEIDVLNVGGGFPIQYSDPVPGMEEVTKVILKSIKKNIPKDITLICEPGRALVGDAGVIGTTVIGTASRNQDPWLYLDTGRFQSFIEMFESEELKYPVVAVTKEGSKHINQPYTLTGPTCDSYDTIMHNISLPVGMSLGDRVYFGSAGAYTLVYLSLIHI